MLHKPSQSILLFLIIIGTLALVLPKPGYASPGLGTSFTSRPTTHTAHAGVDDPELAYDANNSTEARIAYDKSEWEEVTSFDTSGAPTTEAIVFVDFKMTYDSAAGGSGENYRIVYYVGSAGPVVLQDWTGSGAAFDFSSGRVWSAQQEPNDGVWSWTDISNIKLRVEGGAGGGGAAYFYEHEAWVSVTSARISNVWVNPASQTDPSTPFTVNIDIANVDDLYAWEFQLFWNKTILSNNPTSVTEGTFLSGGVGGTTFFNVVDDTDNYNATHGRVWATCTLLGHVAGKTGSGTLATVSLVVDGTGGTTPLALVGTKVVGYEFSGRRVAYMALGTTDGSVTITGVPEFPFGVAMEMALVGVVVYIWWRRKREHRL